MIRGLKFISIPVRDQDRALTFYVEKLGFRIQTDQRFDGNQRWIELTIPGAETGVVLFTPEGHEDRIGTFTGVSFWCNDVRRTYEVLLEKGVTFQGPPKAQPWGVFAVLLDSEGNQFVLSSRT